MHFNRSRTAMLILAFLIMGLGPCVYANAAPSAGSPEITAHCSCAPTPAPVLELTNPITNNNDVRMLQEQLLLLGLNPGSTDGDYGPRTVTAVKMFQTLRGLPPSGRVDQRTWQKLYQALYSSGLEDTDPQAQTAIVIDRGLRTLTVYVGNRYHKQYRVAVGTPETPTPLGDWKIVHRAKDWGTGFGTRWMGLNVPWGIFGIHGTNKPYSIGSYASHGCIRMFNQSVEDLFPLTKVGTPVRIWDSREQFPPLPPSKPLKKGNAGPNVVFLQWNLATLGIPVSADGHYGSTTAWAVSYYQNSRFIPVTGLYDQNTIKTMKEDPILNQLRVHPPSQAVKTVRR
ncbi:MAG: peptidoglycan-binding protein [Solirubrobacterales bacterium]